MYTSYMNLNRILNGLVMKGRNVASLVDLVRTGSNSAALAMTTMVRSIRSDSFQNIPKWASRSVCQVKKKLLKTTCKSFHIYLFVSFYFKEL